MVYIPFKFYCACFRRLFSGFHSHSHVPKQHTLVNWANSFQTTGSMRPETTHGDDCTVQTSESNEGIWQVILASPRLPAVRHALLKSIHKILHVNLCFHPYKVTIVREGSSIVFIMRKEAHFSKKINEIYDNGPSNSSQELHQRPLHANGLEKDALTIILLPFRRIIQLALHQEQQ